MGNGGKLFVESFVVLGVSKGFGVLGESYLVVLDVLYDIEGLFDFVLCCNEGGVVFMVVVWGKLMGQLGICFVMCGLGVINVLIGVYMVMQDLVLMIIFVGQVGIDMKGCEVFQEIDYCVVFGIMVKWVVEIDSVDCIFEIFVCVWIIVMIGWFGLVVVVLFEDMLIMLIDVVFLICFVWVVEFVFMFDVMVEVLQILIGVSCLLILLGGINWIDVGKVVLQGFVEVLDILVIVVFCYQDQFDNFLLVFVGEVGVGMLLYVWVLMVDVDVILVINVCFGEMMIDGYMLLDVFVFKQKLIYVYVLDREIGKVYQLELGIQVGLNVFVVVLCLVMGGWLDWCVKVCVVWEVGFDLLLQFLFVDMGLVMVYLCEVLFEDVILINGVGNFMVWLNKFYKFGFKVWLLVL